MRIITFCAASLRIDFPVEFQFARDLTSGSGLMREGARVKKNTIDVTTREIQKMLQL